MTFKEMVKNNLEIIVNLDPVIEENIAIEFITNKIVNDTINKIFEVPINYANHISISLNNKKIPHKIEYKNEYVSNIVKL